MRINIIFIVLISGLAWISLAQVNSQKSSEITALQEVHKDSVTVKDYFQALLDDYDSILTERDNVVRQIHSDSVLISEGNKQLPEFKKVISATSEKCDAMWLTSIKDSTNKRNDSTFYREIEKYNSNIEKFINDTVKLKGKISEAERDIPKQKKNIEKLKVSIDKVKSQIVNSSLRISGSKAVSFRNSKYLLFVADLDSTEIGLHLINPNDKQHFHSLGSVKKYLESKKLQPLMLTNAGMYTPSYDPEGLYIEENKKYNFELDTAKFISDANFYLKPNGVFYIDSFNLPHIDATEEFQELEKKERSGIKIATQSGPMLVIDGRLHPSFKDGSSNAKIRSGVGIVSQTKVLFAITLDESNFYNFALFFKDIFNCRNALFLDGAISQMYLYDLNANETGGNFGPIISVTKKHQP